MSRRLLAAAAKKRAAAGGDPLFANVVLLSNYTTDTSDVKGHSISAIGSPTVSGGDLNLNGTSQYLQTPASVDWDFGIGDHTIEAYVTSPTTSGSQFIIANFPVGSGGSTGVFQLVFSAGGTTKVGYYLGQTNGHAPYIETTTGSIAPNTKYHIAAVRSGNTLKVYIDGVDKSGAGVPPTSGGGVGNSTAPMQVGTRVFGGSPGGYFNGKIHAIRITKGVARYTVNFTPPTDPFPEA